VKLFIIKNFLAGRFPIQSLAFSITWRTFIVMGTRRFLFYSFTRVWMK